jgi:hypothetical protein
MTLIIIYIFSVQYVCKLDFWTHILWALDLALEAGVTEAFPSLPVACAAYLNPSRDHAGVSSVLAHLPVLLVQFCSRSEFCFSFRHRDILLPLCEILAEGILCSCSSTKAAMILLLVHCLPPAFGSGRDLFLVPVQGRSWFLLLSRSGSVVDLHASFRLSQESLLIPPASAVSMIWFLVIYRRSKVLCLSREFVREQLYCGFPLDNLPSEFISASFLLVRLRYLGLSRFASFRCSRVLQVLKNRDMVGPALMQKGNLFAVSTWVMVLLSSRLSFR